MVNGLTKTARISNEDAAWVRRMNKHANEAYLDPTTVEPDCYDPELHPGARSWFKESAIDLREMTHQYLSLLDRYGIAWIELRTTTPGRITYEDEVQVVAVPPRFPEDWPFLA